MGSFEEGSPDYATLDNAEMIQGVDAEYNSSDRMAVMITTIHTSLIISKTTWQNGSQPNHVFHHHYQSTRKTAQPELPVHSRFSNVRCPHILSL